jgi:hypothetical protein
MLLVLGDTEGVHDWESSGRRRCMLTNGGFAIGLEERMENRIVIAVAAAFVASISLGCSGLGPTQDCVTDGGAIQRAPREVPFSVGGKMVVVSEKYCMDFNDYSFKETVIAIKDGKAESGKSDRVVRCKRIRVDQVSKRKPGVTAFKSEKISKPLLYNEAKDVFVNKDAWNCEF